MKKKSIPSKNPPTAKPQPVTKAYIRTYDPLIGFYDAIPFPGGAKSSCHTEWAAFENIMGECLRELGLEVVFEPHHPFIEPDFQGAQFRIFAHRNRRDLEGELFYKQMYMCPLFCLDSQGWGADHSQSQFPPDLSKIDPDLARSFGTQLAQEFLHSGHSKADQPPLDQELALPESYIFAAIQRPQDYVQLHHSHLRVPDFIRLVSKWGMDTGEQIVFKLHPGNVEDPGIAELVHEWAGKAPNLHVREGNIHALIDQAKGVFTINSGVGFESLIHGKPVVTFGACDYQWATFQANPNTREAAFAYVNAFSRDQQDAVYQFVYHYYHGHCYDVSAGEIEASKVRLKEWLATAVFGG